MDENKTLVTETEAVEVAESVEHTTEETPKTYTEAEFNAKLDEVLGKKIARKEAKIRKEYERNYGELVDVLRAGTGKDSVEEVTDTLKSFYQSKGIKIEKKPEYSNSDIEILARSDAEEIIRGGFEDAVEEAERLKDLGVANMSAREKAVFKVLAEYIQDTESGNELAQIGVTKDEYNSKEFKQFAAMFNSNTPITEVYKIYQNNKPKKEIQTMGSMKNNAPDNGAVKDFYSYEEAVKFKKEDFDKNPALYKAVEASMSKW